MRFMSTGFCAILIAALPGIASAAGTPPVNTDDARLALQISAGLAPSAAPDIASADVASPWGLDPDGRITILDALRLLRAANGLDTVPEGGSGLLSLRDHIDLRSGVERTYVLPRALLFRARLVDEHGDPVPGRVTLLGSKDHDAVVEAQEPESSQPVGVEPDRYKTMIDTNHTITDPETGQVTYLSISGVRAETLEINTNSQHDFTRPELPPLGVLEGTVQGEGFQPVFIHISFQYEDGHRVNASAPLKTGSFRLHVPEGKGILEVSGHHPDDIRIRLSVGFMTPVETRANETVRREFFLPPFKTFQGRVIDPSGARVRTVSFSTPNQEGLTGLRYHCGLSQGASEYTDFTAAMPPGEFTVGVQMDGGEPAGLVRRSFSTRMMIPDNQEMVEIRIPARAPMKEFRGRVVDPSGRPLANASIGVGHWRFTDPMPVIIDGSAGTDADGRFRMSLPEGEYLVSVQPGRS